MMGIQRICVVLAMLYILVREGGAVTFTFVNRCTGTVWPGILSNAGSARMDPTGFELPPGAARAVPAPTGWSGRLWARTGCTQDATGKVLRAVGGAACRSACDAFGKPEFCCSGAYANPNTCRPTAYSQVFKSACPRSYSYAYDDPTSTFTCAGGRDYTITFCPVSTPSLKAGGTTPTTTVPGVTTDAPPGMPRPAGGGGGQGVMLGDNSVSWLASLATGDASSSRATTLAFLAAPLALLALQLPRL
uniref:Thaumatin-like protein n=1 Tax=Leersia perrieri TaxID=77586 RepID=A0A0D9VRT5_9ORYZ